MLTLVLLCGAQFMVVLDTTIVNVALPAIGRDLHFGSDAQLQYVISLYALTFGGFLILAGRMADLFGRRRFFLIGLLVFTVASLACGLAPTSEWMLGARALQGIGSALVSSAALALLTTEFAEGKNRNTALGVWGATGGAAGAAGLIVGGVLTSALGWEWVFFINVPVGVAIVIAAPRIIGASTPPTTERHLDLLGSVLVTGGLALLIYTATQIEQRGLTPVTAWMALSVVALLGAFGLVERRTEQPILPFRLFRAPGLAPANVVVLLLNAIIASHLFFTTLYVQNSLGYSALQTGFAFLPNSVLVVLGATLTSRVLHRIGLNWMLTIGVALIGLSALLLSPAPAAGSYLLNVLPGFALAGLGLGIGFTTAMIAATNGVTSRDHGAASGVVNSAQQVGFALGIAIIVAVASSLASGFQPSSQQATYTAGYLIDAGVALIAMIITLFGLRTSGPGVIRRQSENT
ncbi:MFS transporter [Promicromonospora aerolata]|uniref:MFS transporter n=1 Tax=Promicromonospora aerolata TaxID=195749 RepID=A0ABW4VFH8_9MICO